MKRLITITMTVCMAAVALAMPSRETLKKVQGAVNEIMSVDMQKVKAGKLKPGEAARHAEEFAGQATDEASKFLLLKGAFELYVNGGDYEAALKAFNRLTSEVKDVPDKVQSDIVRTKLRKVSKAKGGELFALYDRIERRMRAAGERERLEKLVKKDAANADARRQLAIQCAVLGDWAAAEEHFAALNGDEKKNAANPDFWWNYAKDDDDLNEVFRARAVALYRQALAAGKLDGIAKVLAEKRMAEMGGDEAPAAAAHTAPAAAAHTAPAAQAPAPAPRNFADRFSKGPLATAPKPAGKPIVLDLNKGVKMELLPCPAGKFTMGWPRDEWMPNDFLFVKPHEVTISRPFWMAKTMVTIAEWNALSSRSMKPVPAQQALWGGEKCAVGWVSPELINEYCEKLTKKFRKVLPKGYVFRLPTEAEWEYALRVGDPNGVPPVLIDIPEGQLKDYALTFKERCKLMESKGFAVAKRGQMWFVDLPLYAAGATKANAWGFLDMLDNGPEMMLDRVTHEQEQLARQKRGFFDYEDATDPLFWQDDTRWLNLVRNKALLLADEPRPPFLIAPMKNTNYFTGAHGAYGFRVVAGPDLVREKHATKGK